MLKELAPNFLDTWASLRYIDGEPDPDNMGWTEDSTMNPLMGSKLKHVRYDRIMIKSAQWKPVEVEVVGTQEIAPKVCISDHYGLYAEYAKSI